jgi:hypothetical protein
MTMDGEPWEGHDASVPKAIRQRDGDAGSPGSSWHAVGRGVRTAEAERRPVRGPAQQDMGPAPFSPGMRRGTDEKSAPRSHLCRETTSRRGLGRLYSSIVLAQCDRRPKPPNLRMWTMSKGHGAVISGVLHGTWPHDGKSAARVGLSSGSFARAAAGGCRGGLGRRRCRCTAAGLRRPDRQVGEGERDGQSLVTPSRPR